MKLFNTLTLMLFAQQAFSQTTYAVVIGIADYEILNYRTGDLRYADKDAVKFTSFLKSPSGGNVPEQNIQQLLNKDATEKNILKALMIFQKANPKDRLIFYFSGHGMENAFVPYDMKDNNFESLLTHAEVKVAFRASMATTKLILADACMSGSMRGKRKVSSSMLNEVKQSDKVNVAMILSSRSRQSSIETTKVNGGIFTYYLLKGLKGSADLNLDKKITIKELFIYISPRVKKKTPNGQAPVFSGSFSDELVLSLIQ